MARKAFSVEESHLKNSATCEKNFTHVGLITWKLAAGACLTCQIIVDARSELSLWLWHVELCIGYCGVRSVWVQLYRPIGMHVLRMPNTHRSANTIIRIVYINLTSIVFGGWEKSYWYMVTEFIIMHIHAHISYMFQCRIPHAVQDRGLYMLLLLLTIVMLCEYEF